MGTATCYGPTFVTEDETSWLAGDSSTDCCIPRKLSRQAGLAKERQERGLSPRLVGRGTAGRGQEEGSMARGGEAVARVEQEVLNCMAE